MGHDSKKAAEHQIGQAIGVVGIDELFKPRQILSMARRVLAMGMPSTFTSRRTMGPFHVREKGCGIVQIDARKNALTGNGYQFDGVSWGLGGSAR